jgi:HSP20 family protein
MRLDLPYVGLYPASAEKSRRQATDMAKMNRNPWMSLTEFSEQLDRLEEVLEAASLGPSRVEKGYVWTPAADVLETEQEFLILLELPGLELADVTVEAKAGDILVWGERRMERDQDQGAYHVLERSYGPFARRFTLPREADLASVRATLKDGLLTLAVGKRGAPGPGRILVE